MGSPVGTTGGKAVEQFVEGEPDHGPGREPVRGPVHGRDPAAGQVQDGRLPDALEHLAEPGVGEGHVRGVRPGEGAAVPARYRVSDTFE